MKSLKLWPARPYRKLTITMNKVLICLFGTSGSGKSTLATQLQNWARDNQKTIRVCSADYFYIKPNLGYNFNGSLLGEGHKWCQAKASKAMFDEIEMVVIDNTNL